MDASQWAATRYRLKQWRLFTAEVDGQPWFHELTRRTMWSDVLEPFQRSASTRKALTSIADYEKREENLPYYLCMDLARLGKHDTEFTDRHEALTKVLTSSPEETALLAACIELAEPGDANSAFDAVHVVGHARAGFGVSGNLLTALRSLNAQELIVVREAEKAIIVVPFWPSALARAGTIGKAAHELRRLPVPRLATTIFDFEIRPLLGDFIEAGYGIGRHNFVNLARKLSEAPRDEESKTIRWHARKPAIILNARVGELWLFGHIRFETEEQRDEVLRNLDKYANPNAIPGPMRITAAYAWPQTTPVQSMRLVTAAELLVKERFGGDHATRRSKTLPAPESLREELQARQALHYVARDVASPLEREILDLNRDRGFAFATTEGSAVIAEINGRSSLDDLSANGGPVPDFWKRIELHDQLNLDGAQSIGRIVLRSNPTPANPIPEALHQFENTLHAFNRAQTLRAQQPRIIVPWDAERIRGLLLAAMRRRASDAQALLDADLFPHIDPPSLHECLFVVLNTEGPTGALYMPSGHLLWMSAPREHDSEVRVWVQGEDDVPVTTPADFAERLGLHEDDLPGQYYGSSILPGPIAHLLGYRHDSVRIDVPRARRSDAGYPIR